MDLMDELQPQDRMPLDAAIDILRRVSTRPAGGVVWSKRELAERSALVALDRLAEIERRAAEILARVPLPGEDITGTARLAADYIINGNREG